MSNTLPERFGANLKAARERRKLSQDGLARLAGVSQTEISRLERGLREPLLSTIVSLITALEAEGAELIPDIA